MKERRRPDVLNDREALALLRDEPELLAIADAIHATLGADYRRRRRRLRVRRLAAASAATVVIAATLAVTRPLGRGGGGLVEAALAAVPGDGPVIHAVVRTRVPGQELIDLASGRSLPVTSELEFWFDEQRGILHTLIRRDGQIVADILATPRTTTSAAGAVLGPRAQPLLDPMLIGFATDYRQALARGQARSAGRGLVGGRAVVWLDTESGIGRQRIALDARSLRPIAVRALIKSGARASMTAEVLRIDAVQRRSANFQRPSEPPPSTSGGTVERSVAVPRGSVRFLGRFVLWAGPRSAGLELRLIQRQTLRRVYPKSTPRPRRLTSGVNLLYGSVRNGRPDWRGRFLEIQQAARPEPAYGFLSRSLRLEQVPRAGFLRVERRPLAGSSGRAMWVGQLRRDGRYVTLTASSRAILLAAARALRPIGR